MKFAVACLVAIMMLVTNVCSAANWVFVISDTDSADDHYVDTDSIEYLSDNSCEAWIKTLSKKPTPFNGKYIQELLQRHRYTKNKKICVLQTNAYFTDGTNAYETGSGKCYDIPPDTFADEIWKRLFQK
jgi:hypothetical protein